MKTETNGSTSETVQRIALGDLIISERNTRHPKPADVSELALSMKNAGQTTPAIVRPDPKRPGKYQIAAGSRRFIAAPAAGFDSLACVVRQLDDNAFEELILIENLQREDPDPRAEVELIDRLVKRGVHTAEQISAHLGKSKHWAQRRIQLLKVIPEIRKLWSSNDRNGIAHFSADMMSILGSLPVDTQKSLIDDLEDGWNFDDCTSRQQLEKYLDENVLCRLDKAPFDLNDKRFFVRGCGPGCACDSSALSSLFDFSDGKEKPARCLKPECFKARLQLAAGVRMAEIEKEHGDLPIVTKGGAHSGNDEIAMFGKQINVRSLYDYEGKFHDSETKGAKKVLVWNVRAHSLKPAWFKPRAPSQGGSASVARNLKSSGARLAERKRILQGKRLTLVHDELLKALIESKHTDCTEDVIDLVTVLGLPYEITPSFHKRGLPEWSVFDKRKTAGFRISRMSTGYGSCYRTLVDAHTKNRLAVLWQGLKSCLANAMKPLGNVGDVPFYETDMRRVAKLISFPFGERKKAADLKILPPKTWGPVNIYTLEPTNAKAAAAMRPDSKPSPGRKRLGELMKKRWAARRGIKKGSSK